MTRGTTLEGDDDLLLAIQRLGRLMDSRRVSSRIVDVAGANLTKQGVQILRALYRSGKQPIAVLATAAHMDIAAVSRQLRQLEDAGLVQRATTTRDGRVALVSLTPSGRRIAKRIREVGLHHLSNALCDWEPSERTELARLMTKLVDDLMKTEITRPRREVNQHVVDATRTRR
jgi:MarR family transcriptional regulator, transcriptional regulator for hemolysin